MPSIRRRAVLGLVTAGTLAGCTDRLSFGDDENTSPADRRVSPSEPGAGDWLRPTRSVDNDLVSPTATPPRDDPAERWRTTDPGRVTSIVVADGVVFAGGHEGCAAFRLEDGERLWSDTGDDGGRPLAVVDGRCYTVASNALVAREVETGAAIWRYESADRLRVNDLVELEGTVYCPVDGDLYGIHADTGDHRWMLEDDGYHGYLAVADDELHWVTPETYRVLTPNGPERPDERGAVALEDDAYAAPSYPAVVDRTIGLGGWSMDGPNDVASIGTLTTRGTIWKRPFERATLTPAVLEDRLLVVGYDNGALDEASVAALERETGDPIWERTLPQPVGPPAVADGVCYVGGGRTGDSETDPGSVFALEVETGDLRWERDTPGSIGGHALALVDDAVVVGTDEGLVVLE